MSVQVDLIWLIGSIFGGAVYPFGSEESPVPPYATFFRVAGVEHHTLDINGGTGNTVNTRLQIDVWAASYAEAQAKAAEIKAGLKEWVVENVVLVEQDFYEPETKLHRVMLDVSTWHL